MHDCGPTRVPGLYIGFQNRLALFAQILYGAWYAGYASRLGFLCLFG